MIKINKNKDIMKDLPKEGQKQQPAMPIVARGHERVIPPPVAIQFATLVSSTSIGKHPVPMT